MEAYLTTVGIQVTAGSKKFTSSPLGVQSPVRCLGPKKSQINA